MSTKITAFNHIFEQRISHLLKQIRKLRKEKGSKEQIKACIKEAKHLRKKVRKDIKKVEPIMYTITLDKNNPSLIVNTSDPINITSVEENENHLVFRFFVKDKL